MSSIGIDLGSRTIKVCEWKEGENNSAGIGPEVVISDRNQREFPARLCFKGLVSNVCDQRSGNVVMNLRNYIWGYKPVIGSNELFDSKVSEKVTVSNTSRAQFTVMYNNETFFVDSESALSLILQYVYYRCFKTESISYDTFPFEMKAIRENSKPVAISIPSYYRDSHIRGLELAISLSQLGQAVFIPEGIAIALDYGYVKATKNQFPEEGKVILFCDMGELATTVTIVRYTNSGMHVLASCSEMLGGKDFDAALVELLYSRVVDMMGEISRTEVVEYKLKQTAERVKADLSAEGVNEVSYSFELVAGDDEEIEGEVTKEDMITACASNKDNNLFDRFYNFVFNVVEKYATDVNIDVIEVSGGSMRIPMLRSKLLEAVQHNGKDVEQVSTTLNCSEACARGTCLFSQKYMAEKEINISSQIVEVPMGLKEKVAMEVCGYKGEASKEGRFTITSDVDLSEGTDHDWVAIERDSKELLRMYVENNREYRNRQEAMHEMETSIRTLQNFVSTASSEPNLKSQYEQDQTFLNEVDNWMTQTRTLYTVAEYEARTKELEERAQRYHSTMNIQSNTQSCGDKKYKGTWVNGKRMGWFHRYSQDDVLEAYGEYLDDKRCGKMTIYYPSGAVKATMYYRNDILHGKYHGYHENGQLADYREYQYGEMDGYRQLYYDNGQLQLESFINHGIPVYQYIFYRNGMMRQHSIYNRHGTSAQVSEFDSDGYLMRKGIKHNNQYKDKVLMFYRNHFYAVVNVVEEKVFVKNRIVPKEQYQRRYLDQQFTETNTLSTTYIPWKPITTQQLSLPSSLQVETDIQHTTHLLYSNEFKTEYDNRKAQAEEEAKTKSGAHAQAVANGEIPIIVNDEKKFLSKVDSIKMSLYDSNIVESVSKEYSLSGDLLTMVTMDENKHSTRKTYYTLGIDSTDELIEENLRLRRVESTVNGKVNGECIVYYNNGSIKKKGTKKDGKWITSESFLNTGKKI